MDPNTPEYKTYVMKLLERAITERNNSRGIGGATKVALELNTSPSLISQLRGGTYPESSAPEWYRKIVETYGSETITCTTLGVIPLNICADERSKPAHIVPSAAYSRQRRTCKSCPHNTKGGK